MISLDNFREDEWNEYLRARDAQAVRRARKPVDYKFDRIPRGRKTNAHRRRRKQTPIQGINHRRIKKVR
jgi:hypothetical protein